MSRMHRVEVPAQQHRARAVGEAWPSLPWAVPCSGASTAQGTPPRRRRPRGSRRCFRSRRRRAVARRAARARATATVIPRSLNEPVGLPALVLEGEALKAGEARQARRTRAAACRPPPGSTRSARGAPRVHDRGEAPDAGLRRAVEGLARGRRPAMLDVEELAAGAGGVERRGGGRGSARGTAQEAHAAPPRRARRGPGSARARRVGHRVAREEQELDVGVGVLEALGVVAPDWRRPARSPIPRRRRSSSAIAKPSASALEEAQALGAGAAPKRRHRDGAVPRPTRPRSWCSWARPKRSAPSITMTRGLGHVDADLDHRRARRARAPRRCGSARARARALGRGSRPCTSSTPCARELARASARGALGRGGLGVGPRASSTSSLAGSSLDARARPRRRARRPRRRSRRKPHDLRALAARTTRVATRPAPGRPLVEQARRRGRRRASARACAGSASRVISSACDVARPSRAGARAAPRRSAAARRSPPGRGARKRTSAREQRVRAEGEVRCAPARQRQQGRALAARASEPVSSTARRPAARERGRAGRRSAARRAARSARAAPPARRRARRRAQAASAHGVLPEPTSPCSRRRIGRLARRSSRISSSVRALGPRGREGKGSKSRAALVPARGAPAARGASAPASRRAREPRLEREQPLERERAARAARKPARAAGACSSRTASGERRQAELRKSAAAAAARCSKPACSASAGATEARRKVLPEPLGRRIDAEQRLRILGRLLRVPRRGASSAGPLARGTTRPQSSTSAPACDQERAGARPARAG